LALSELYLVCGFACTVLFVSISQVTGCEVCLHRISIVSGGGWVEYIEEWLRLSTYYFCIYCNVWLEQCLESSLILSTFLPNDTVTQITVLSEWHILKTCSSLLN